MRTVVLVAGFALALVPAGVGASGTDGGASVDPHREAAREALGHLSLVDRAGQLIMTGIPGTELSVESRGTLRALRPGGFIVFGANYRSRTQLARLVRSVDLAARDGASTAPRVLASVDQEGGVVRRIPDAPPTRSHPWLGAVDRITMTRSQARAAGRELRGVGIRMDLAPVADLDVGPSRTMRQRSFGSSPARVSRHVGAFVQGLQAERVAAAVKHFPGFGGANVNSDDALAVVRRTRRQLEGDLQPFRHALESRVDAVMMSHGVYRALDPTRPASTSPLAHRLLRRDLGFTGVIMTDSLHATGFGAATGMSVSRGCGATVRAGADIVLLTGRLADAVACRRHLVTAVRSGALTRRRLDASVLRVLELKSRLGLLGR